jgi:PAS domain S-box-containing protein
MKHTAGQHDTFRWVCAAGASGSALIALMGLAGYLSGSYLLGSVRADYIPMAPATAVSFIILALMTLARGIRRPGEKRTFFCVMAAVVALFGLLEVTEHFSGRSLGLEEILFPAAGNLNGMPVGRMSPAGGFGFFISGCAILMLFVHRRDFSRSARVLGILTFVTGFVHVLAYLYGNPLMYGNGSAVPMALTTAVGFVLLGTAVTAAAGRVETAFFVVAMIFTVLSGGIITVGYLSYKHYERNHQSGAELQLAAVADLKINELTQWRKDRLSDGYSLCRNSAFSMLTERFFRSPDDVEARRHLSSWLGKYPGMMDYNQVRLMDPAGNTKLVIPPNPRPPASAVLRNAAQVVRSGQVLLTDFYFNELDQNIYLAVMVPVFATEDVNQLIGVLAIRIDPFRYLYPFIQRWPAVSETAETLLVRRDGDDALFLNELRFKKGTALSLRIPLTSTNTPAVAAALGKDGVMAGEDYRSRKVFAFVRTVPDSPWAMVARRDVDEVFAPVKEHLRQTVAMVGILLFATATFIGLVWRQQRIGFYRERAENADKLRASNEYLDNLINYANGPIVVLNPQFLITRFNHAAETLTGRKASDVAGQTVEILFPKASAGESMALIRRTLIDRQETVEIPIFHSDGFVRTVIWNTATLYAADRKTPVSVIAQGTDVTEHRKAELQRDEMMEKLRLSNRDLEQFAYVASHDLQEPLRMVSSYMQLLDRRYSYLLSGEAKEFMDYAVEGARRMRDLIGGLLEYSRVNTQNSGTEICSLQAALDSAIGHLEMKIVETQAEITRDNLPEVYGDLLQLTRVFQNLLGNALKFCREGMPKVHISCASRDRFWHISVADNGIGIDPAYAEKIFLIFQRLNSRSDYEGSGIGLAICKRIIERHGGKIWVEPGKEKGSVFHFTLPKKGG